MYVQLKCQNLEVFLFLLQRNVIEENGPLYCLGSNVLFRLDLKDFEIFLPKTDITEIKMVMCSVPCDLNSTCEVKTSQE